MRGQTGSTPDTPTAFDSVRVFLKGSSFYTKTISAPLLSLVGVIALTFFHDLSLLHSREDIVSRNAIIVAVALPSILLGILLHRSRVRQLTRKQPPEDTVLSEMASIILALALGSCLLAIVATR